MEIFETTNYDQFKFLEYNREIDQRALNKLLVSMKIHNDLHLHPIVVDDQFNIVDGQHRFHAARQLGYPIFYVVDNSFAPEKLAMINQAQTNWSVADYINRYAAEGVGAYVVVKELAKKYDLLPYLIVGYFAGEANGVRHRVKAGTLTIDNVPETMELISDGVAFIEAVLAFDPKMKGLKSNKQLHMACREFFSSPLVDKDLFFQRLPKTLHLFKKEYTARGYVKSLIAMYCYHSRGRKLALTDSQEIRITEM